MSTLRLYRCMRIHTEGYNDVTAAFNGVAHAIMVAMTIMCVCGSVRMEGLQALASGYVGAVIFASYGILVSGYGGVNRASQNLLNVVRRTASVGRAALRDGNEAWFDREIRVLVELRVSGGSTFYYDQPLLLTLVDIIFSQSVSLLIMN